MPPRADATSADGSDRGPFFIVGTGRSGTTMFRNLLRHHPRVYIPRETHWIPILFHAFGLRRVPHGEMMNLTDDFYMAKGRTPWQRIMIEHKLDDDAFRQQFLAALPRDGLCSIREFMETLYRELASIQGRDVVGDKTPDYGLAMGVVQTIWPDARFVHICRDGRDVALSMSKTLSFRLLVVWGINHWWAIGHRRQYERMMAEAENELPIDSFYRLWRDRLARVRDEATRLRPGTYVEIPYERVLANTTDVLEHVASFLDLPGGREWIADAAATVRRDNLDKNRDDPAHQALTDRFAGELAAMGFGGS